MIFIAVFALLVFGPKRLPEMARSIGKAVREFRNATQELTEEIRSDFDVSSNNGSEEAKQNKTFPKPGPKA